MKSSFLIALILLLSGCILHYDRLTYYVEGYAPNNSALLTNGYYYTKGDTLHSVNWPNSVKEMYFFKDGCFKTGSNHENIDSLNNSICKYGLNYGSDGFYTIIDDTIYIEYLYTDPMGNHRATRVPIKAIQVDSAIKIIEWGTTKMDYIWTFHENDCVKDTVSNWIVNHRKYKLKTIANNK